MAKWPPPLSVVLWKYPCQARVNINLPRKPKTFLFIQKAMIKIDDVVKLPPKVAKLCQEPTMYVTFGGLAPREVSYRLASVRRGSPELEHAVPCEVATVWLLCGDRVMNDSTRH